MRGATIHKPNRLICGLSHINHFCAPIIIITVDATQILSTLWPTNNLNRAAAACRQDIQATLLYVTTPMQGSLRVR